MRFSSRKWAEIISNVASRIYFLVIIAQIPLFRFPCRIGTCQTPVDIMACQLVESEILPQIVVKALVYPGAIKRSFMEGTTIPSTDQLLNSYKFNNNMRAKHATNDLRQLEVIAGSYLCVAGALLGLIRRGRTSLFGLILIMWGITRERLSGKNHAIETICIYPEMMIITVIAFLSVRKDVRRLIRCCKPKCIVTKFN